MERRDVRGTLILAALCLILLSLALPGLLTAANPFLETNITQTGTSQLVLNATSLTFNGYGYYNAEGRNFTYNAVLESGTSGNTFLSVLNRNYLFPNGIILISNNPYGSPNYSRAVRVQIANFTAPGNYSMELALVGADPSPNATLTLVVLPWKGNLNATPLAKGITTAYQTTTTANPSIPGTAPQKPQGAAALTPEQIALVIGILAAAGIVAAAICLRRNVNGAKRSVARRNKRNKE